MNIEKFWFFLLIAFGFTFLVGASKGVCDTLQFHFSSSVYAKKNSDWWNPATSWKNKYTDAGHGNLTPRFPGATTIFVAFTDAWHTFQFLESFAICGAIIFFGWACSFVPVIINLRFCLYALIALKTMMQFGFWIFYK